MLLDTTLLNLFTENFGAVYTSISIATNLITQLSIALQSIVETTQILSHWPTALEIAVNKGEVVFIVNWAKDYLNAIYWLTQLNPYLLNFDYLHLFFLKQYFYNIAALASYQASTGFTQVFSYSLNTIFLITFLTTKWAYAFVLMIACYFFTNINQVRYQYGFNFYFNYFKMISDLGEQEYGSYDDFKFFLFFLVQLFVWYCWIIFLGYTFSLVSNSFLNVLTVIIMVTILLIPVKLLWDFGLAFAVYIRGAANSANLVVESVFDLLGVIIIFTRFIVQNIRFLLVFVAFFELFEWAAMSFNLMYFFNLPNSSSFSLELLNQPTALFALLINSVKIVSVYLYHLIHLIIISFMQIGVYLMVSFWLFFFLYTSFFKVILDSYFLVKRSK
jgi:hypothetical protein